MLAREGVPVLGLRAGLADHGVGRGRCGPELEQVPLFRHVLRLARVLAVHADTAVAHPVVRLGQVQFLGPLAGPAHQRRLADRPERRLHDVFPFRAKGRLTVVQLDGEADLAGVQPGHEEQRPRHGRAEQTVALPAEAAPHVAADLDVALDRQLPVVDPHRVL
nr:hypothetical protein GCM10017745_44320 [Saccharothrix mutabilis subsp. capreolus]